MREPVLVVGAAIVDDLDFPRTLLAARRSAPPALAGKWEFPGGKVEAGEQPTGALRREVREELGIEVQLGRELAGSHEYGVGAHGGVIGAAWPLTVRPDGTEFVMRLWVAAPIAGEPAPEPREDHDQLRTLQPGEWRDVGWIAADEAIVDALLDAVIRRNRASWC